MDTVKSAYTTAELARLLGVSRQAIDQRSDREIWDHRPRQGRGGGSEWLLESMPQETRLAIAKALAQEQARNADIERRKQSVNSLALLPVSKQEKAEARAMAVRMARQYVHSSKLPRTAAYEMFSVLYNRGEIAVPAWARAALPKLCRASLINWEKSMTAKGVKSLADKRGQHRVGTGAIDQEYIRDFCLAHIYKFPHVKGTGIHRSLKARLLLEEHPVRLPSERRVQAWYKAWKKRTPNYSSILLTLTFGGVISGWPSATRPGWWTA